MICFEISINGEGFCTAGVGEDGVLDASVSWGDSPTARRLVLSFARSWRGPKPLSWVR
jgi:hypothetical protein